MSSYGEPDHRIIADFLSGIRSSKSELAQPNALTKSLRDEHRGVCLLYPVREQERGKVSIGFELFYPENRIPFDLNIGPRFKTEEIVVTV